MAELFRVITDRVRLTWASARLAPPRSRENAGYGHLRITSRRPGLDTWEVFRSGVTPGLESVPHTIGGPLIHEETDYLVALRGGNKSSVRLLHRDPLTMRLVAQEGPVSTCVVNFRAQVGLSRFTVVVDDVPELDFEVEVFPTKLDYRTDYEQLLADVQDQLAALALEYLRATWHGGQIARIPNPTELEWIVLLRHVADVLERSLRHIAAHPVYGLERTPTLTHVARLKRVDASVRAAVSRGQGSGGWRHMNDGIAVRSLIEERRARSTLDTREHRWLAARVGAVRRRLAALVRAESSRESTAAPSRARRQVIAAELSALERRVAALEKLAPLAEATGEAPASLATIQLLSAPGYREAYRAIMTLQLGLRIEGEALGLSLKDLSVLYEYWCLLSLLREVSEALNEPLDPKAVLSIDAQGLRVRVRPGRPSSVPIGRDPKRIVTVIYQPQFRGENQLVPQTPDMLVTIQAEGWPCMHLVLDAKYRLDDSPEYRKQFGAPGPPPDALNAMHRYRDAIVQAGLSPKRTVVQAAAAFPHREATPDAFAQSHLWQALERIGVGAVPMLPGDTTYVRRWVRAALREGGWSVADGVPSHVATEYLADLRRAAGEVALVLPLPPDWLGAEGLIAVPYAPKQRRQLVVTRIALYSAGAVAHDAPVTSIEVRRSGDVPDAIRAVRPAHDDLWVVYRLGGLDRRSRRIVNHEVTHRRRPVAPFWTTRLGLDRAAVLEELFLETEPEWRLFEALRSAGVPFVVRADRPTLPSSDPVGRARFVFRKDAFVTHVGAGRFEVALLGSANRRLGSATTVVEWVTKALSLPSSTRAKPVDGTSKG